MKKTKRLKSRRRKSKIVALLRDNCVYSPNMRAEIAIMIESKIWMIQKHSEFGFASSAGDAVCEIVKRYCKNNLKHKKIFR